LRRSGRVKSKSPVVEENTASDAYFVHDESSGDDFVDGNGKGIEVGNRVAKKGSGSNVSHSSGIKNKGVDITAKVNANDDETVKDWDARFKKGKEITPSYLKSLIRKSKVADMNFKLNFIVMFTSVLGNVKPKGICDLSVLHYISRKTDLGKINWCEGIGNGKLKGPFFEKDDPMLEDEDGFLWKLNIYVDNIRKERDGFERTFVAASNVLRGNQFIADIYQQYRASLHYKNVGNEGNSCSEEVFTRVDKVVEEFESSKKGNDFEAPSFSFGVTQDFDMVLSLETPVTDTNTPVLGSANQLEPIKAGTQTGTKASRKQMESLVNGENIDNVVMDAWSEYLNSLKSLRVNMIDSKNNLTNEGYHKTVIVTNTNDMVVATVLQKSFCDYLARLNPNKIASVLRVEVTREDFDWQTDKRPNDYGVFLTRYMKAYMGTIISKWACGLETKRRKQNMMLAHLRKRYAAKLLLSKCNVYSDSVRAQLDGIQVAEVHVKRMKLPTRAQVTENVNVKTIYVS
nr:ulp1 protease family, C-terminal catalytic domain-containing protein [Tanacetum cinerariifolium]